MFPETLFGISVVIQAHLFYGVWERKRIFLGGYTVPVCGKENVITFLVINCPEMYISVESF